MIYGYRTRLKKGRFIGYRICAGCRSFTPFYIARLVFVVHICFIPVFWYTKKRYIMCGTCERGSEISKKDYKIVNEKFKTFFTQQQCMEHYEYIKALCQGLRFDEYNQNTVYQRLCDKYNVQEFEDYYMMIIKDVLKLMENNML